VLIEHEGVIYRGLARWCPIEIWDRAAQQWKAYEGRMPKPFEWGSEITAAAAAAYMRPRL